MAFAITVVVSSCVLDRDGLPARSGVGVLTAADGTMYMVLTPCAKVTVDAIALMYVPPGTPVGTSESDDTVLAYKVDQMSPRDVLAPLDPRDADPLFELVERNDELLTMALSSTKSPTFDDRFYVEATVHGADGVEDRLGGSWSADLSRPNTVVLHNEVFSRAADRHCGVDDIGWSLPN